ncbi:4,5-DOPA dioxygenase extradiol [Dyadobacter sp. LHD-138]|uniref:4,5-DOPA-extradiol-dioxygenase n=1 Tax=Dyadobacter sp. LHD-138 TaxID=3071413 RepID=UPI0027E09667|nr:4,5-DOPA dioxygenase extradiol [Dyadobacter sp. LHD-138]MDQ6478217.1 4,5-DOPA dioxygenase extradiol [Dyadobacter sp. LHD-138]
MKLNDLKNITEEFKSSDLMPVLFTGHGSPMNGIEENEFTDYWKKLGQEIVKPTAVLCISAHWLTKGTKVTAMVSPKTIHDFGGFPQALFDVEYPAPGNPELAKETAGLIKTTHVGLDHEWGLDHGTWSVVKQMYPDADIPVLQLSIDYGKPAGYHYALAQELSELRKKGVLIIGSGNMVHNLRMVAWDKVQEPEFGYDWAIELNSKFKELILDGNHDPLIHYEKLGIAAQYAIPTPDHYYPLLYSLGLQNKKDSVSIFNDKAVMGSLTMTSIRIG